MQGWHNGKELIYYRLIFWLTFFGMSLGPDRDFFYYWQILSFVVP